MAQLPKGLQLLADQTPDFEQLQEQVSAYGKFYELCAVFTWGGDPKRSLWINAQSTFNTLDKVADGGIESIIFFAGDPCA